RIAASALPAHRPAGHAGHLDRRGAVPQVRLLCVRQRGARAARCARLRRAATLLDHGRGADRIAERGDGGGHLPVRTASSREGLSRAARCPSRYGDPHMPANLGALERLEIERACERLVHAYVRALDDGDMNAAADCFAANGSLTRPSAPDQVITGREAIRASLLARPKTVFTRHLATSVLVDVEGPDSARGISYLTLFQATRPEG